MGREKNKCHTTFTQDITQMMLISIYENPKCSRITPTPKSYWHTVAGQRRQTRRLRQELRWDHFCVVPFPLLPPMHTHAYTHTCLPWQMACDVPLWTWHERVHSLSPGLTERQPRPAEGTPECLYTLDVTLSESFHLLGRGQREPTEEAQQYWLRRVRCWVTAKQQLQQSS